MMGEIRPLFWLNKWIRRVQVMKGTVSCDERACRDSEEDIRERQPI